MKSANRQSWADEFECYAGFQRAKFTYHVMVSTHDFHRDEKLTKEANRIFLQYGFPATVLDSFPGNRLDLSQLTDPEEIQRLHDAHLLSIQASILRWEREVQALSIRWKGMIEELQPLFVSCHEKYKTFDRYINTGIVFHLGYHRFEQASIVDVQDQAARGTAVAVLKDPRGLIDTHSTESNPSGIGSKFSSFLKLDGLWPKPKTRRTRIEIQLVKTGDEWKIDSVPFR